MTNPGNRSNESFLYPLSRLLMGSLFIVTGVLKLPGWSQTAGNMASHGIPYVPFLLALAIALEIIGGICILTGAGAKPAAALLFLYLIPVTLVFHRFWGLEQPEATMGQLINFLKNAAIMGGLLQLSLNGPGTYSLSRQATEDESGPRLKPAA